jgi:hypothetical protein
MWKVQITGTECGRKIYCELHFFSDEESAKSFANSQEGDVEIISPLG